VADEEEEEEEAVAFKAEENDFPTLGSGNGKAKGAAGGAWGKKA